MHLARPLRPAVRRRTAVLAGLLLVPLGLVPAAVAADRPAGPPPLGIEVLGNRADLVSGGDALVRLRVPTTKGLRVDVGGRDVTRAFAKRADGQVDGLLTGLRVGRNVVRARVGGQAAQLTVTNAPAGGPVFSGPQVQPWTCAPGARDAQCNRPPTYTWLYKSTAGGGLRAYDPKAPAGDVATTRSDTGATVPFIVRQETGVLARDEYRIAVLFDPAKPSRPWAPQAGVNRKLVITHGSSCDTSYEQGTVPDVLLEDVQARGYVVMSHALDNAGHNCNIITQAE